jgi:ribonuclease HIII
MAVNNEEEQKLVSNGYEHIAGIDESGMGCFAGDVYVAVVILPQ